jgi:hypothetical protein
MKKLLLPPLLALLVSCNTQEKETTAIQKIAEANGFENWANVEELRYTFNVKVNDSLRTSRAWTWNPTTNKVSLTTQDSTVTYNHKTEAAANQKIDQQFINDQYWLLFPFHLVWDEMEWKYSEEATAPISGQKLQRITVQYPGEAGYTPGDAYEVYFGEDHMIQEWVYLSGGSRENPFATTWENYENHKGIPIAKTHRNKDGSFELFFTEVSVVME